MDFINEPRFCIRFGGYIFIVMLIISLSNKKGNITDAFSSFVTKTLSLFSPTAYATQYCIKIFYIFKENYGQLRLPACIMYEDVHFRPEKETGEGFMSDYSSENIREIYERHFVTVYRVCFMYLRNVHDTEDAVHNTFMKLIEKQKHFESTEHEKAWLIRVCSNVCKNMLRTINKRTELNGHNKGFDDTPVVSDVMVELSKLPDELKIPVYLFYCDGYNSSEIGNMLHISASAVRSRLQKAREQLKEHLSSERSIV